MIALILLLVGQSAFAQDGNELEDVACPADGTPQTGVRPKCTVQGLPGYCNTIGQKPPPCAFAEDESERCEWEPTTKYYCYLNSMACRAVDQQCVSLGLLGKCTPIETTSPFVFNRLKCTLADSACAGEGTRCALGGNSGFCRVSAGLIDIACEQYAEDMNAFAKCADTLSGDVACRVNQRCLKVGATCYEDGYVGSCSAERVCSVFKNGARQEFICPAPTVTEVEGEKPTFKYSAEGLQLLCNMSTRTISQCLSQLQQCSETDEFCPFRLAGISRGAINCVRDSINCQKEGDSCIENNAIGHCKANEDGSLYCRDKSDVCPKGTPCKVSGTPGDNRQGLCSDDFTCRPRYVACSTGNNGAECWTNGLKGKCRDGANPDTPDFFPDATCVLDDTPACKSTGFDGVRETCVLDGRQASCGYSYEVIEQVCGLSDKDDGCFFEPEIGQICPPDATYKPTAVDEECQAALKARNVEPTCLVTSFCGTSTANNGSTCYRDGAKGTCSVSCRARAFSGYIDAPELCTSNTYLTDAEANAFLARLCPDNPDKEECQDRYSVCFQASRVSRTCLVRYASLIRSGTCVADDQKCTQENGICFENGFLGTCKQNDQGLYCHEVSDNCPVGSECELPQETEPDTFPGEVRDETPLKGICDQRYNCVLRNNDCLGSDQCFVNGREGQCISKSTEQAAQLAICLIETGLDKLKRTECFAKYSSCFLGCEYPAQACGAESVCAWPRDQFGGDGRAQMRGGRGQRKRDVVSSELVCQNFNRDVPLVERYSGRVLLLEASGVSGASRNIYAVAQSEATEAGVDSSWAQVMRVGATSVKLVLREGAVLDLKRFSALGVLAVKLRAHNDVHDAHVVIGSQLRSPQPPSATPTNPQQCTPECAEGLNCRFGSCVGRLEHGTCFDGTCICDDGWSGDLCTTPRPTAPVDKDGAILLSQWVFHETGLDEAQSFVDAIMSDVVGDQVPDVHYQAKKNEITQYVVVKVYGPKTANSFDEHQRAVLLEAWKLMSKHDDLISHTAFVPPLPNDLKHKPVIAAPAKANAGVARLCGIVAWSATMVLTL